MSSDIDVDGIPILNIYGLDYRCIINRICKSETINFHCHAALFNYGDLYNWRGIMVQVSEKTNYFENNYIYFISYSKDYGDNITPLYIEIPQTNAYIKSYDNETKWIYFLLMTNTENLKKISEVKYAKELKRNLIVYSYIIINFFYRK